MVRLSLEGDHKIRKDVDRPTVYTIYCLNSAVSTDDDDNDVDNDDDDDDDDDDDNDKTEH